MLSFTMPSVFSFAVTGAGDRIVVENNPHKAVFFHSLLPHCRNARLSNVILKISGADARVCRK
ncbi:MAG: hypothetical protein EPN93_18820 [Spirochaetes bacterium]|nr:MAG: hypothetical protein EPN93_18820 [Spirochaetota bacterium]